MKKVFKMKYNRLSSFIYLKEFCRLYRHNATAHSAQGEPQQAPSAKSPERTALTGVIKKMNQ